MTAAPDDRAPTEAAAAPPQVVDPAVSAEKFAAEVAGFRALEREHQRRGWWLLEAVFPSVFVVFATPQLRPPAVVCGALLDFTNYDLEPPSVALVDPFTREPYRAKELPTVLHRRQVVDVQLGPDGPKAQQVAMVPLMQAHDPNDRPFLCIPGVREYHAHPAHTGDAWLTHRGRGAGTLVSILNAIHQYGVQPINNYGVGMRVVGFEQGEPPQ